ncbi:MAG TPA: hypothetical protein VLJ76_01140 [Gaiellaceae bacterium]|nr:hypothetical protein [Gaiellaceae bacterium]
MADVVSEEPPPGQGAAADEPFFRSSKDVIVNPRRFGLAYLVLAIGTGLAIGLAVVFIGRGSSHHAASKAKGFTPDRTGELGAREIGSFVSHEYKLPSGRDLVGVVGQHASFQNVEMNEDLIQPADRVTDKDVTLLPLGNGIMFLLCGLGSNCAISEGQDNATRNVLIEQEAFELTLRTFKTDSSVDSVTALLPPLSGTSLVSVIRRKDVAAILSKPLSAEIPNKAPYKVGDVTETAARALNVYMRPNLYTYQPQALPDGTTSFVLDPYPKIG